MDQFRAFEGMLNGSMLGGLCWAALWWMLQ